MTNVFAHWEFDRVDGTDAFAHVWTQPMLARNWNPEGMRARLFNDNETNAARDRWEQTLRGPGNAIRGRNARMSINGRPVALRPESLERTLQNVSFRMDHVRFWRARSREETAQSMNARGLPEVPFLNRPGEHDIPAPPAPGTRSLQELQQGSATVNELRNSVGLDALPDDQLFEGDMFAANPRAVIEDLSRPVLHPDEMEAVGYDVMPARQGGVFDVVFRGGRPAIAADIEANRGQVRELGDPPPHEALEHAFDHIRRAPNYGTPTHIVLGEGAFEQLGGDVEALRAANDQEFNAEREDVVVIDDPLPPEHNPLPLAFRHYVRHYAQAFGTPFEAVVFIDIDAVLDVDEVTKAIHAQLTLLPSNTDYTWTEVAELPHGLEVRFNGRKEDPRKFVKEFVDWVDAGFTSPSRNVVEGDICSISRVLAPNLAVQVGLTNGQTVNLDPNDVTRAVVGSEGDLDLAMTVVEHLVPALVKLINDGAARVVR